MRKSPSPFDPTVRRLVTISSLVAAIIVFGACGFRMLSQAPWIDCFYMSVITLTTVGYREIIPLDNAGRIFVMVYLGVGLSVFMYSAVQIGEWIFSDRFRSLLEQRKMDKRINGLEKHFIVCGCGRMGATIAAYLHRHGKPFVVVDNDEERVAETTRDHDWPMLVGDATHDETLLRAGIERAVSLATVLPTDADNLYVVLSARILNANLQIVARAEDEEAIQKMERAGANRVISPFNSGAVKMARFMLSPSVEDFLEIADGRGSDMELADFQLTADSPLVGNELRETTLRESGVMVIGIRRASGERLLPPEGTVRLEAGDCLFAFGAAASIASLLAENERRA